MEEAHKKCVADPASCPEKKQKKDYKGKKSAKGDKGDFLRGKYDAFEGLTPEEKKAVDARVEEKIAAAKLDEE